MTRRSPVPVATVVALALLSLAGCAGASRASNDRIYLTPEQEKDIFVSTSPLGEDTSVVMLASVPKARYENGAIVIRPGGRELVVVQPHAWQQHLGSGISLKEAEEKIARAERIDASIAALSDATNDLRLYMQAQSDVAQNLARRQAEAEVSHQERLAMEDRAKLVANGRITKDRQRELDAILRARGEAIAAESRQRDAAIADLVQQKAERLAQLAAEWAERERLAKESQGSAMRTAAEQRSMEMMAADRAKRTVDYKQDLVKAHAKDADAQTARDNNAIAAIRNDRDAAMAREKAALVEAIGVLRQQYDDRVATVVAASDRQIASLQEPATKDLMAESASSSSIEPTATGSASAATVTP